MKQKKPTESWIESFKRRLIRLGDIPFIRGVAILPSVRLTGFLGRGLSRLRLFLIRMGKGSTPRGAEKSLLQRKYLGHLSGLVGRFPRSPRISILIPVYRVKPEYLTQALQSVEQQVYGDWEVCIVDDHSDMPEIHQVIRQFSEKWGARVQYRVQPRNLHISATSNACLDLATGDFVALLDHDDLLLPNALAEFLRYLRQFPKSEIFYSDERVVDEDGASTGGAFHKPAWSPLLHLCVNYTTHLSIYRRSLLLKIGGFRKGFEGAQDHDLMLRASEATRFPIVHIPHVLYLWRSHELSTASGVDQKPYAVKAGERAVREACVRRGIPADVSFDGTTRHYRLHFRIPSRKPLVSILIPTRNQWPILKNCLDSILNKTRETAYEILLADNGSTDTDAREGLSDYQNRYPEKIRVYPMPGPFNFARINNELCRLSRGSRVVLLNNDTEVISETWLEELIGPLACPEVGVVGAKLIYPDGRIQHGGIILMGELIGGHAGRFLPKDSDIYIHMLQTLHECSAVTGACLAVTKKLYWQMGGLDEVMVPNGYGDVDFCLRVRESGYTVVYSPHAELIHHESPSRGSNIENEERFYLMRRHARSLLMDPYLNPNFEKSERWIPDSRFERMD